jgi:hypothetical protein
MSTETPAPQSVAVPVYAFPRPAPLARLGRIAKALKVLHGDGCAIHQVGPKFVAFTPGERCGCQACDEFLRLVADLDYFALPTGMIVCTTCGNKRCPHATDHREDCTGSNEPGQPGSAYGDPFASLGEVLAATEPPPRDSVRAFLATLPLHPDAEPKVNP